ncbi:MAG: hypothetical protein R2879_07930 [Saprospiraceae bacterium]
MQTKPVFQTLLFVALLGLAACSSDNSGTSNGDTTNQSESSSQTGGSSDPVAKEIEMAEATMKDLQSRLADTSLEASQREMVQKAIDYQKEKIERFKNLSEEDKKTFRETMQKVQQKTAQ